MAERRPKSLLDSAAAGDAAAFRHIIAAYHEDMRRVCLAVARDPIIVEEAVQAAWLIAWQRIGNVRDEAHLRPWLVSIAVNEAKRLLRKRRRRAQIELTADGSAERGGMDPAAGIPRIDLRAAVLRLDPDDRALLAMRYGDGFDSNELAVATGQKPPAVRQRLKRLLDRLREDLRDG